MTQTQQSAPAEGIARSLAQPTLVAAFQATVASDGDRPALRTAGGGDVLTWAEYGDRVRRIATGLHALGVRAGDSVALMMGGCVEFHLVDTAAMHLGAAPFSVYHTNPVPQILPLVEVARPRVIVAAAEYEATVREVAAATPSVEQVVIVGSPAAPGATTLAELERLPSPELDFDAAWRAVSPDAIAALVFSSGTTGAPKGVEWSHGALIDNLRGLHALAPVGPGGRVVSYLPMAHLLERFLGHYGSLAFGYDLTAVADPKQLAPALTTARPTRFYGVPRIFEKLAQAAAAIAATDPALEAAYAENLERVRRDAHAVERDPAAIEAIRPIRARLGLDEAEWRGSAGAPARVDVLEAFAALGLPIAEIWGMSETALSLMNPPTAVRIGTVGKPQPGFEARLAEDGELLLRGPVFSGYRDDPRKTRETVDRDGWIHTGDVAAIDDDGYYRIVDRKKELIVNSAGKNIPPAMVEGRIKQHSPLIGQVVAIGDRQPYLTALVVLDEEALPAFAREHGLAGAVGELAGAELVRAEVARAIDAANATLARIEQVKRHRILPVHWTVGGAEVTNTMKLRRKVIAERYAADIEALYA